METLPSPHLTHPGLLIAIGGAEDKTRERVILRYFLQSAGGPDANLVVLATASMRLTTSVSGKRSVARKARCSTKWAWPVAPVHSGRPPSL